MGVAVGKFRILLVDDDDLLSMDAAALGHPGVIIEAAPTTSAGRERLGNGDHDAVAINLALKGALAFIEDNVRSVRPTPILALAAKGIDGASLEYTLTLAELRGAAGSAPKPIDAVELVAMALDAAARRSGKGAQTMRALLREFDKLHG